MQRFVFFVSKVIYIFLLAFVVWIVNNSIEKVHFINWLYYLATLVLIVLFVKFVKIKSIYFCCLIFILSFLVHLVFVMTIKTEPISDFLLFYKGAVNVAKQNYDFINNSYYFNNWAYQTGFVLWLSFFIRFFNANLMFFQVLNCIILALTNVLIFSTAKKISGWDNGEKSAKIVSLIFLFSPQFYIYSGILTNQFLSTFCCLLALNLFFEYKDNLNLKNSFLIGFTLFFANFIRPVVSVVLLALFSSYFIYIIYKKTKIRNVIAFMGIIFIYLTISFVSDSLVKIGGINHFGLENNYPEWKFVLGLNHKHKGSYNWEDTKNYFEIKDWNLRKEKSKTAIKNRLLMGKDEMILLFDEKVKKMWGKYDETDWQFHKMRKKEIVFLSNHYDADFFEDHFKYLSLDFYICTLVLVGISMIIDMFKKDLNFMVLSICTIMIIYFMAHLFIEVQPRYREFFVTLSLPLTALLFNFKVFK